MSFDVLNKLNRMYFDENGKLKRMRSSGIICKRINNGKMYFLLVKEKSGKWSFPKGLKELYEDEFMCAKREFFEEVGIDINNIKVEKINRIKVYNNTYFLLDYNQLEFIDEYTKNIFDYFDWDNLYKSKHNIYQDLQLKYKGEILNISWIELSVIKKSIKYFNTDVKAIVFSKTEHWFHKEIFGEEYSKKIFELSRYSPIHFSTVDCITSNNNIINN
jgi:8-oxo-dGTP pyrophosphatase MutT (NUDIX family)